MDIHEWKNGTVTEIIRDGEMITVTDIGERVEGGRRERVYLPQEVLDLADEHDALNRTLRRVAKEAMSG